jgi:hypothetical protein
MSYLDRVVELLDRGMIAEAIMHCISNNICAEDLVGDLQAHSEDVLNLNLQDGEDEMPRVYYLVYHVFAVMERGDHEVNISKLKRWKMSTPQLSPIGNVRFPSPLTGDIRQTDIQRLIMVYSVLTHKQLCCLGI